MLSLKKAMFQTFECHIGVPCDGQYIKIHENKESKELVAFLSDSLSFDSLFVESCRAFQVVVGAKIYFLY